MDISRLLRNDNLLIELNVEGRTLNYFGTGGVIDAVIYPRSTTQLIWVLDELKGQEYTVLGKGSNTLISDRGYRGAVISTKCLSGLEVKGDSIYAEAGVSLKDAYQAAISNNLSGLERLSMIPGSIGGAVCMNAGAYGSDISQMVEYVDTLVGGDNRRINVRDMKFSYRSSIIKEIGAIVLGVSMKLIPAKYEDIHNEMVRCQELRAQKQPKAKSLGSVFKRYNDIPAARYINALNIKGMREGGAYLSMEHCNFIVNGGDAITDDYITLARRIQDMVYKEYGIFLASELQYIGEYNEDYLRLSQPYKALS